MNAAVTILSELVAVPSINPMGKPAAGPQFYEHAVTAYLEEFFEQLKVPWQRQTIAPLRDNIIAVFEPARSQGSLLWEVHQDTVPVDGMTIDPFREGVRGNRFYGRGACDVKGSMACMLATFRQLALENRPGGKRVILACTVDEEHTFLGVQRLVKDLQPVDMAIVAEPTDLDIVHAHKGVLRWQVNTKGLACHASTPKNGTNAIYRMARVVDAVEAYANRLSQTSRHGDLGPATISVGTIQGGVSPNTVPDRCTIDIDRRLLPGETAQGAIDDLHSLLIGVLPTDEFTSSKALFCAPPLSSEYSGHVVSALGSAINSVLGSHRVRSVGFCTDASTLAQAGVPSVVFGPGDIAQAHTNDEWIDIDQMNQACRILHALALAP